MQRAMKYFWSFTEALQWEQEAYELGIFENKVLIAEAAERADAQLKAAREWKTSDPRAVPAAKR